MFSAQPACSLHSLISLHSLMSSVPAALHATAQLGEMLANSFAANVIIILYAFLMLVLVSAYRKARASLPPNAPALIHTLVILCWPHWQPPCHCFAFAGCLVHCHLR